MISSQENPPDISIILEFEDVLVDWDTLVSARLGPRLSRLNETERDAVVSQLKHPQHSSFILDMPCSSAVQGLWSWLQALQATVQESTGLRVQVSICLGGGPGSSWTHPLKQQWVLRHLGPSALVHAVCGRNRYQLCVLCAV